ncbi:MAG TPA: hypothetical protein PKE29_02655 [Phycisphaerales bacterium]|nr:hypothetical protein [Phycisphaerales bacterium]
MGDDLRKVRAGEPLRIPARTYNAFVDAAAALRNGQADLSVDPAGSSRQHGVIPVRNDSGADLDAFHVLAIDGPLFLPATGSDDGGEQAFQNTVALKGVRAGERTPPGQFVVSRGPIRDGAIGLCVVHGVTPVRILIEDENHEFADLKADETVLASAASGGTAILWKESGTGEKWAVVEIGRPPRDRIVAILGEAVEITGERFRWRYPWHEARLDGDPGSDTFGRYVRLEHGLSSAGDSALHAINRFESHHSDVPTDDPEGTDGFGALKSLFIPGQLENPDGDQGYCPRKAAVPMLRPVLKGVAVELAAEKDTKGKTVWAFQANNPAELTEMDVPVWEYV